MRSKIEKPPVAELIKYTRGTGIVLICRVAATLLGFVFSITMARIFAPQMFGLVQLIIAAGVFIGQFLAFGTSSAVTHYIARLVALRDTRGVQQVLTMAIGIVSTFIFAIAVFFILFPGYLPGVFFSPEFRITPVLVSTALIACLTPYYTIAAAALRGLEKFAFLEIWDGLLKRLFRIIPLFFLPAIVYVWTIPGSMVLLLLIVVYCLVRFIKGLRSLDQEKTELFSNDLNHPQNLRHGSVLKQRFINYLWPLALASIVAQTKGELGMVLIGLFSTEMQAGYFKIALSIGNMLTIVLGVTNVAFLPMASRLLALKRKDELLAVYRKILNWIWILIVPVGSFLVIFSSNVLQLLYGHEYVEAKWALVLVVIGSGINAAFGPTNNLILAFGKTKSKFIVELVAFILVLSANALLIPKWGAIGASVAFVAGLIFWNIALYIYLHVTEVPLRAFGQFHILYLVIVSGSMLLTCLLGREVLQLRGILLLGLCIIVPAMLIAAMLSRSFLLMHEKDFIVNIFKAGFCKKR